MNGLVGSLRFFGFGGTALPGIWVEKYFPSLISQYARHYKKTILITGTNGKTTVQLALGKVLASAGFKVTGNFSGSNMLRGIATTLLSAGIPHETTNSILLCEVEEATMPKLTEYIYPDIIVITNMYRDQLDAYGELDKTAEYIKKACQNSLDALLILNGDDPIITTLSIGLPHKKITYSLGEYAKQFQYEGRPQEIHEIASSVQSTIDTPRNDMHGESHEESDKAISLTNTQMPDIIAKSITVYNDLSTEVQIENHGKPTPIKFAPPGMYNVYNALAAYTASLELGVKEESVISALATVQPPFGRGETITFQKDEKTLTFQIFLVKNPAGYSQVWDMLRQVKIPFNLILGLNDNIADGRDVSWIWDIELIPFAHSDTLQLISFTGKRAYDMALRMKYAEIEATSHSIIPDIATCLEDMMQKSSNERRTFALMTYTAMNQFRSALGRYITLSPYTS